MTIPLFSGDGGRSLLIRRGTDSYGEEGRRQERLQYSVGFSPRCYGNRYGTDNKKNNQSLCKQGSREILAGGKEKYHLNISGSLYILIAVNQIRDLQWGLNPRFIRLRQEAKGSFSPAFCPQPFAFLNKINNSVSLNAVNLQPALDEVFHVRS